MKKTYKALAHVMLSFVTSWSQSSSFLFSVIKGACTSTISHIYAYDTFNYEIEVILLQTFIIVVVSPYI